jgi:hypothetical protein
VLSHEGEARLQAKFEGLCASRNNFDALLAQMGGRCVCVCV